MSNKEQADRKFTTDALRSLMDEVAFLQVATTFHVTDGNSERVFYFVRGGVRLLSSGPHAGPGLPGYLLERQRIGIDALHEALEESRSRKKDFRQVLIDKGVLSKQECDQIVNHLIRDELLELVFWHDAIYMVHTQEPPEEIFKLDRPILHGGIDNDALTRDVLRWLDDWARIGPLLPSDQIGIETTAAGREANLAAEPSTQRVLDICRDRIPLRQVWLAAGLPLNELCLKLVELGEQKLLTLDPDDIPPPRSPEEQIADLEESLRHLIARDLVSERLASLYQKIKRPSKAVEHLELIAESALSKNDVRKAVDRYKRILKLQPQNVGAFERLLEFSRAQEVADVKAFALNHIRRLTDRSLGREAERCADLLETYPTARTEVQEFRASLLASQGRREEAAVEYTRIAGVHEESGDIERAVECLSRALSADESNAEAQSRLDRCRNALRAREEQKSAAAAAAAALEVVETPPRQPATGRLALALTAVVAVAALVAIYFAFGAPGANAKNASLTDAAESSPTEGPSGDPVPAEGRKNDRNPLSWFPTDWTGGDTGGDDVRDGQKLPATRERARRPVGDPHTVARPVRAPAPPTAYRPNKTSDPCDPDGFRKRPLDATHTVYYADGCPLFVREEGGDIAQEFPGKEGTRWAFSHGGRFICRWEPGEHAAVFTLPQGLELPLGWRIPEFAAALAIGKDRIVVRENQFTAMFSFDGTPVTSANLPEWEEGAFVEDRLILTRSVTEPRTIWVVEAATLDFLWSCINETEGFIIR